MSSVPALPANLTPKQQTTVSAVRQEYGFHVVFKDAFKADDKDFRIEFPKKFVKDSKLTIVFEVSDKGHMELDYETLEDSNKYFYVRRDPYDDRLYVGTRGLEKWYNHSLDLPLTATTLDTGKPQVFQVEWKSDNKIEVTLNGTSLVPSASKLNGALLEDCARLLTGELYIGDTTKTLRGFKVYEVHHTSADMMTLTDENLSYTLPALYVMGSVGVVRFSGKCIMRESPTGEIRVQYDGQHAAALRRLQRNMPMAVVVGFNASRMILSLVGAPNPAKPVSIPLPQSSGEPSIKHIRVSRNLQTNNVEVYVGQSTI
ncbi:hypothetical protein MTO96_028158 [Rhipicephalus appendiculatus]